LEGQTLSQIDGAGQDKPVFMTFVGPTSVMIARVVDLCSNLYAEWPNLYLNFIISDVVDRLNLVRSGKAALAIVSPEQVPNEMDSKVLMEDPLALTWYPRPEMPNYFRAIIGAIK
jgi:DNA-binding transcriptional LysR family regulator